MNATAANTMFDERIDPGRITSFLLAAAMHLALFAVLVFGVRWQNRPPEAVMVELWNEPPVAAPVVVEPKPAPPPVAVRPDPVLVKPDIAEKAPPPKPRAEPPKAPARPRDEEAQRQIREQLQREQTSFAVEREQQLLKEQLARDADAARRRGLLDYESKIRTKVRGNIVLPPELQGNPDAQFLVVQLPTGEVLSTKLVKSSGHRGYDEAVERAILKSSPLPKPDKVELFSRELRLTFRPKEKD